MDRLILLSCVVRLCCFADVMTFEFIIIFEVYTITRIWRNTIQTNDAFWTVVRLAGEQNRQHKVFFIFLLRILNIESQTSNFKL